MHELTEKNRFKKERKTCKPREDKIGVKRKKKTTRNWKLVY